MPENIVITSKDEEKLRKSLDSKIDSESTRLKRYLSYADLSRTKGSPLHDLVERLFAIPEFKDFDTIKVPEIVPADISFDLFNFPTDHPARSRSDTYYVDEKNILRTHTTIMWYYYFLNDQIKKKIEEKQSLGVLSYGKVYRKDEIDRHHMNIFHQMDGLYLLPREKGEILQKDLEKVLGDIAKAIFGQETKYRFNKDQFPYTDPSIEMEVDKNGYWVEVLGGGLVRPKVMENLGLDPKAYTGWAFGFGLERLAIISMELPDIRLLWSDDKRIKRQLKLGNKYQEVSKYPAITRDISFVVGKDFVPNNYFDLIRDIGADLVEEVELLDKYEDEKKFGTDKVSYTYRIVYRSPEKTLETSEIEPLQDKVYKETKEQFGAEIR